MVADLDRRGGRVMGEANNRVATIKAACKALRGFLPTNEDEVSLIRDLRVAAAAAAMFVEHVNPMRPSDRRHEPSAGLVADLLAAAKAGLASLEGERDSLLECACNLDPDTYEPIRATLDDATRPLIEKLEREIAEISAVIARAEGR